MQSLVFFSDIHELNMFFLLFLRGFVVTKMKLNDHESLINLEEDKLVTAQHTSNIVTLTTTGAGVATQLRTDIMIKKKLRNRYKKR